MIPTSYSTVQRFRVRHLGTWQTISLRFRGEGVGGRYSEALWQRVGTLKAIKASSLQQLIDIGEVIPI